MGKTVGVICEYNPFHKGHAYQLGKMRGDENDLIVAVMSGNTVERGEIAITDKYTRAAMALSCGGDLVLELPFPYSSSSADFFATAGISLLAAIGADKVCFGAETREPAKLPSIARTLEDTYSSADTASHGSASFFEALAGIPGGDTLGPNDLLGVAYLRAIARIAPGMETMILPREGDGYREENAPIRPDRCPSAASLRRAILTGDDFTAGIPEEALGILTGAFDKGLGPANPIRLDRTILTWLRLAPPDALAGYAECGGGVIERVLAHVRDVVCFADLLERSATKSYTNARLRRAVLFAMTGVLPGDLTAPPAYTTLLGANERGRAFLHGLRKTPPSIPILTKPADAHALGAAAERQLALSLAADALFVAALPAPLPADRFAKSMPVMV